MKNLIRKCYKTIKIENKEFVEIILFDDEIRYYDIDTIEHIMKKDACINVESFLEKIKCFEGGER